MVGIKGVMSNTPWNSLVQLEQNMQKTTPYVNRVNRATIHLASGLFDRSVNFTNVRSVPDGEYWICDSRSVAWMKQKLEVAFADQRVDLVNLGQAILVYYAARDAILRLNGVVSDGRTG